jgi:hypothetical protein
MEVRVRAGVVRVFRGNELEGAHAVEQDGLVNRGRAGILEADAEQVVIEPAPACETTDGDKENRPDQSDPPGSAARLEPGYGPHRWHVLSFLGHPPPPQSIPN